MGKNLFTTLTNTTSQLLREVLGILNKSIVRFLPTYTDLIRKTGEVFRGILDIKLPIITPRLTIPPLSRKPVKKYAGIKKLDLSPYISYTINLFKEAFSSSAIKSIKQPIISGLAESIPIVKKAVVNYLATSYSLKAMQLKLLESAEFPAFYEAFSKELTIGKPALPAVSGGEFSSFIKADVLKLSPHIPLGRLATGRYIVPHGVAGDFMMGDMYVVRFDDLSPLTTMTVESLRSIKAFRVAEEKAYMEALTPTLSIVDYAVKALKNIAIHPYAPTSYIGPYDATGFLNYSQPYLKIIFSPPLIYGLRGKMLDLLTGGLGLINSIFKPVVSDMQGQLSMLKIQESLSIIEAFPQLLHSLPTYPLYLALKLGEDVVFKTLHAGSLIIPGISRYLDSLESYLALSMGQLKLYGVAGDFMMGDMYVVRFDDLSPLTTMTVESLRSIKAFRIAEEKAYMEALTPTLEPKSPLTLRPIVHNVFNITVSEDVELRELERRITQILNEQVRRYYGSSVF